jgi:GT2 family glycosyltransferase
MSTMTAIVVNYNTCEDLEACLATLVPTVDSEIDILVVDNASSDASVQMVRDSYPGVRLCVADRNLGYGAAANLGIASCTSTYALLLNSDTRLATGSLSALISYLDEYSTVAIVGPRLVNPDGTLQVSCFRFPSPFDLYVREKAEDWLGGFIPRFRSRILRTWAHDEPRRVPYVMGAAMAIRRAAFVEVGGFSESFFMYFEEVDLAHRLARAGWKVHFAPLATFIHTGGASTRRHRAEMRVRWFQSSLEFYRRNYSRFRLLQLQVVMGGGLLARLLRDLVRARATKDPGQRARIAEDITVWKRVLGLRQMSFPSMFR